jgi:transcription initiation factor TFIIIB Brf1 subunit/transcription initiation factor TFIIB
MDFDSLPQNLDDLDEDALFDFMDSVDKEKELEEVKQIGDKLGITDSKIVPANNSICGECDSTNLMEDMEQNILVCTDCGQIVDSLTSKSMSYQQNCNEDAKSTFQTNCHLPQSSLATKIVGRSRISRLNDWSAMPYKERSLYDVMKQIQYRCQKANILKCIEDDALIMYKNVSECKHISGKNKGKFIIIRGKNRRSLIAACVFFACKRNGKTRSPKEIAEIFDLKYTDITKGRKTYMKLMKQKNISLDMKSSSPEHFVTRYCRLLKINKKYTEEALHLCANIRKLNIASEHTPLSVATGIIMLVVETNKLSITKREIAEEFDVSEVTINKTFKKLKPYREILTNDQYTERLLELMSEENKKSEMPNEVKRRYKRLQSQKS